MKKQTDKHNNLEFGITGASEETLVFLWNKYFSLVNMLWLSSKPAMLTGSERYHQNDSFRLHALARQCRCKLVFVSAFGVGEEIQSWPVTRQRQQ